VTGGYFEMRSNPALINLHGLHALETVSGYFEIMDNRVLSELGLNALTTVGNYQISDNPALPECQADAVDAQVATVSATPARGPADGAKCFATRLRGFACRELLRTLCMPV